MAGASVVVAVASLTVLADGDVLVATAQAARSSPIGLGLAVAGFASAFALRALAWQRLLPDLSFGHAWAAIHVSLAGNHVLPLRLGEPLRVASVVRRTGESMERATASTVTLRAADTLTVVVLAGLAGPGVVASILGAWAWVVAAIALAVGAVGWRWLGRIAVGGGAVRLPDSTALAATVVAWMLEAVLVHQAAAWADIDLGPIEALGVTAVSVASQLVAIAPGGIGTYEATATAAYVALGFPPEAGLAAALAAHAVKTAYSLIAGAVAVLVPSPGLLGRLRLPSGIEARPPSAPPADAAPVILVLPAHDEEATVADVIRRLPPAIAGHPTHCIVVDDGSTDATASRAADAGAEVVRRDANQGLGSAVRTGIAAALRHDPAVVAFCDADGEYAPEELERLVAPVLAGSADYVVGSRFTGVAMRMRPHRRVGNIVLTAVLRAVARHRITDGQSGYRAMSFGAASAAEIIHDYNYAQVLTLDLLGKGYRYAEVPISYGFRTEGRSFVRLLPYLRRVVPAVWRELNAPVEGDEATEATRSVLHHM